MPRRQCLDRGAAGDPKARFGMLSHASRAGGTGPGCSQESLEASSRVQFPSRPLSLYNLTCSGALPCPRSGVSGVAAGQWRVGEPTSLGAADDLAHPRRVGELAYEYMKSN